MSAALQRPRRFLCVFLGYEGYVRKLWETLDLQGSQ